MTFIVACPCGRKVEVGPSEAGTSLACPSCDKRVEVPRLSQLRESADIGAYEHSALDTLERLKGEGRIPEGKRCMCSSQTTGDCLDVHLTWGDAYHEIPFRSLATLAFLCLCGRFGSVAIALWTERSTRGEGLIGQRTDAVIPIRIDHSYHRSLMRRWSRKRLYALLEEVPVARRLLEQFPRATIKSCKSRLAAKAFSKSTDPDLS